VTYEHGHAAHDLLGRREWQPARCSRASWCRKARRQTTPVTPIPPGSRITNPGDYLPVHNFVLVALGMNMLDAAIWTPWQRPPRPGNAGNFS